MLNPNLEKYVGGEFSYKIFMKFVKEQIAPYTQMNFVEEDYYKILWEYHFNKDTKYKGYVLEISRGHSKTEFGIWVKTYKAIIQPLNIKSGLNIIQQLVVSADNTVTEEIRTRIEDYLYANPEFRVFLPSGMKRDQKNPKWNSAVLTFSNHSRILFRSIKMKRGLHVDDIWLDDPTTESSTLKDEESITFFNGAIFPMGTNRKANILITGTPLRVTDILNIIGSKNTFFHLKLPCMNEKGELLSPNRFSKETLAETKETMGAVFFQREYMLDPITDESALIKRRWMDECLDYNWNIDDKEFDYVMTGVDFASSESSSADKSTIVDIGVKDKKMHILRGREERGKSALEVMGIVGINHRINRYEHVAIEENFVKSVVKEIKQLKMPLRLFWMGCRDGKRFMSKATTISKLNSIMRLGGAFENREIVIPYNTERQKDLADKIMNECVSWALKEGKIIENGVHPDYPISLILCHEVFLNFKVHVTII
jgi:hypothetical protein